MAENTLRTETISTPKDVVQEIISDFCVLHGGEERAMPIITHQFKQAGISMKDPSKQGLPQLIERLTQVTASISGDDLAKEQRAKYLRFLNKIK